MIHRFWLIRHALVHPDSLPCLYGTNDVPVCDAHHASGCAALCRPRRPAAAPGAAGLHAALAHAAYRRRPPCARAIRQQTPLIDAAFIEQNFGDFQGLPIRQFDARPVAGAQGPANDGARHPFWPIHAAETPPGGESFDAMIARVGGGLERLAADAPGAYRHRHAWRGDPRRLRAMRWA